MYSPCESLIRFFFLSMIFTIPFGSISPMSPEMPKHQQNQQCIRIIIGWEEITTQTCMKPSVFYRFSGKLRIFVITRKDSLPSHTYLTTRGFSKRVIAHFWDLFKAQLIVDRNSTSSSNHAHFIWKPNSGWSTCLCQACYVSTMHNFHQF